MNDKEVEITSTKTDNYTSKPLTKQWDKCLDDYNNYLREYIKHYKKSLNGNLISFLKYPYMMAKSEAIYESLYDAQKKSHLTKKQIKRMAKIQTQIANPCLT